MTQQLTLGITLRDDATFANFIAGRNDILMHFLHNFLSHSADITDSDSFDKVCSPDKGALATCPVRN